MFGTMYLEELSDRDIQELDEKVKIATLEKLKNQRDIIDTYIKRLSVVEVVRG